MLDEVKKKSTNKLLSYLTYTVSWIEWTSFKFTFRVEPSGHDGWRVLWLTSPP
jgi:hypothetical protein